MRMWQSSARFVQPIAFSNRPQVSRASVVRAALSDGGFALRFMVSSFCVKTGSVGRQRKAMAAGESAADRQEG